MDRSGNEERASRRTAGGPPSAYRFRSVRTDAAECHGRGERISPAVIARGWLALAHHNGADDHGNDSMCKRKGISGKE